MNSILIYFVSFGLTSSHYNFFIFVLYEAISTALLSGFPQVPDVFCNEVCSKSQCKLKEIER